MLTVILVLLLLTIIKSGDCEFVNCSGECVELKKCKKAETLLKENRINPQICGFIGIEPLVCCGEKEEKKLIDNIYGSLRRADIKCKKLQKKVKLSRKKIFAGTTVRNLEKFPFMAALGYGQITSPVYRSGGFLIEQNIVITAAHCVEYNGEPPTVVRIGSHPLSSNNTEPIKIIKVIPHPNYQQQTYENDIAVIILANNSKEHPACLLTERLSLRHDNRTIAFGFGTTSFGGPFSDALIQAYMNIVNKSVCNQEYKEKLLFDSQLCVLGERRTFMNGTSAVQDTCQGDSGGPLILKRHPIYVVGIVSYGRGCGTEAPGIYTYVAPYYNWIDSIVRLEGEKRGLHDCKKLTPPYFTINTCNKNIKAGLSCSSTANIGSNYGDRYEFNSVVMLGYGDTNNPDYRCDGVLIDYNVVLTAAQCALMNGKLPQLVRTGNSWNNQTELIKVIKVIQHPDYKIESYLNDIAIIFLAENAKESYPACLWGLPLDYKETDVAAVAISSGTTSYDGILSTGIIAVQMNIVNDSVCEKYYGSKPVSYSEICAITKTDYVDEDTYQGNSGGPIFLDKTYEYVISLVSYGKNPGFFTNITSHLDWIETIIWPEDI